MSSSPPQSLSSLPNFDPRLVPVLGVDRHLPPVPLARLTPQALRHRLQHPPIWQPEVVVEPRFSDRPSTAAAVLIPIVMHSRPTVLLTLRTAHMSTHSGQIAFPGGKRDADDADAAATALREAREEVGLASEFAQIIGSLPVYVTGSAFVITPVVALIRPGFALQANPHEVADVFEVPLEFLLDPGCHQRHAFESNGTLREWFSMPYRELVNGVEKERFIWGATAGILRNFYRLMSAGD